MSAIYHRPPTTGDRLPPTQHLSSEQGANESGRQIQHRLTSNRQLTLAAEHSENQQSGTAEWEIKLCPAARPVSSSSTTDAGPGARADRPGSQHC